MSAAAADFLLYEQSGAVVTLTMNAVASRNALTGAGPVFSSGGNLKHMKELFDETPAALRNWYRHGIQRLSVALYNLDVPTIAAVNGPAIGAGCDLTCMCDIRIAADTASFAESFVKVGLIPGDGGAWLLPRVVGMSKAMEMAFTGDPLSAAEALACGLVSKVVPAARLMHEARALAERIAKNPGTGLRMTKQLMREGQHMRLESLLELSAGYQAIAHKTPQHVEAVNAFVEKRPPNFGQG